jgi:predicted transcriptional regulator
LRLLEAQGFGPVLVLNQAEVVMGAAYRDQLRAAPGQIEVGNVMRFGVSTVRPSEDAAALAHRMGHAGVTRVVVTRSDGTLIGLFFAADVNLCCMPISALSVRQRAPHLRTLQLPRIRRSARHGARNRVTVRSKRWSA